MEAQDEAKATKADKISAAEAAICFQLDSARTIHNKVAPSSCGRCPAVWRALIVDVCCALVLPGARLRVVARHVVPLPARGGQRASEVKPHVRLMCPSLDRHVTQRTKDGAIVSGLLLRRLLSRKWLPFVFVVHDNLAYFSTGSRL
jgi:hypothetical protein